MPRFSLGGPAAAFWFLAPAIAQTRFVDDFAALPAGPGTDTVVVFDIDGDGFPDLLVGPPARLLHNDGSGRFADVSGNLPAGIGGPIAVGDLDGDGAVDLVSERSLSGAGELHVFHNDGAGRFTFVAELAPAAADFVVGLALGDVDGDGDLDLLVARRFPTAPAQMQLFLNQGRGAFALATGRLPATTEAGQAVRLVDVDGDGDLDILRADLDRTRLLINDGSGHFTDESLARMPLQPGDLPLVIATGDLDGDGDVDLLLGSTEIRVLQNNGAGVFVDVTTAAMPPQPTGLADLAVRDLDGDGDLDLAAANLDFTTASGAAQNRVYRNDGSGRFTDAPIVPAFADLGLAIAAVDLDRDGDVDLVAGGLAGARVLVGARRHVLAPPRVHIGTSASIGWFAAETGTDRYLAAAVSLALLPQPVQVPGFGLLLLAPPIAALDGQLLVGNADSFTQTLAVPPLTALIGTTLHFQGLVLNLSAPAGTGSTNRSSMVAVP